MPDPPTSAVDDDENGPVAAAGAAEKCRGREASGDVGDTPGRAEESTTDGRETEERRTGTVIKVVVWMPVLLLFKGIGGERVVIQSAALGSLSSLSSVVKGFSANVVLSEAAAVFVVAAVVIVAMEMVEIVVDASLRWAATTGSWARADARSSDATVVETVRYFRAGGDDDEEEKEDFVVGHMHTTGRLVDGNGEGSCCCPEDIVVGELGAIKEKDDAVAAAGGIGVDRGSGTD